jgi:hypothetical protein
MAKIPAPTSPLAKTPTWELDGKRKGPPSIVLSNGTVADVADHGALTRWTALKLMVALERYPFEWKEDRAPRVKHAVALARALTKAARFEQLHVSMGRGFGGASPKPQAFSKSTFDSLARKTVLQRFNPNQGAPMVVARTGGPLDVQYEWSLRLGETWLTLHAFDTNENRARMNAMFDVVRRADVATVWATLGNGHGGGMSARIAQSPLERTIEDHDLKLLSAPWKLHIGCAWIDLPGARELAEKVVAKQKKVASIDAHGLLFETTPSKSAIEKDASRVAAHKAWLTFKNVLYKLANQQFHDKKARKILRELGMAG